MSALYKYEIHIRTTISVNMSLTCCSLGIGTAAAISWGTMPFSNWKGTAVRVCPLRFRIPAGGGAASFGRRPVPPRFRVLRPSSAIQYVPDLWPILTDDPLPNQGIFVFLCHTRSATHASKPHFQSMCRSPTYTAHTNAEYSCSMIISALKFGTDAATTLQCHNTKKYIE